MSVLRSKMAREVEEYLSKFVKEHGFIQRSTRHKDFIFSQNDWLKLLDYMSKVEEMDKEDEEVREYFYKHFNSRDLEISLIEYDCSAEVYDSNGYDLSRYNIIHDIKKEPTGVKIIRRYLVVDKKNKKEYEVHLYSGHYYIDEDEITPDEFCECKDEVKSKIFCTHKNIDKLLTEMLGSGTFEFSIIRPNFERLDSYHDLDLSNLSRNDFVNIFYALRGSSSIDVIITNKDTNQKALARRDRGDYNDMNFRIVLPFGKDYEIVEDCAYSKYDCLYKTYNKDTHKVGIYIYNRNTKQYIYPEIYDDIVYSSDAIKIVKNGKAGFDRWMKHSKYTPDKVPCLYDDLHVFKGRSNSFLWDDPIDVIITEQNGKKGMRGYYTVTNSFVPKGEDPDRVVCHQHKCVQYVVPCLFEEIEPIEIRHNVVGLSRYDISLQQMCVKLNGFYGVYDHKTGCFVVPPIFKNKVYLTLFIDEWGKHRVNTSCYFSADHQKGEEYTYQSGSGVKIKVLRPKSAEQFFLEKEGKELENYNNLIVKLQHRKRKAKNSDTNTDTDPDDEISPVYDPVYDEKYHVEYDKSEDSHSYDPAYDELPF